MTPDGSPARPGGGAGGLGGAGSLAVDSLDPGARRDGGPAPAGTAVPHQAMGGSDTTAADVVSGWIPDDELDGFERREMVLSGSSLPQEPAGPLTATLVRCCDRGRRRAVLYVHGWNDYFFQRHLADFWTAQGYDFLALDLRRYGRNLREGMLAGYVDDLSEHFEELALALDLVRSDHDHVVLAAHSTGGLIASLFAHEHPGCVDALVLNSPWLDMQGGPAVRRAMTPVVERLAQRRPTSALRLPDKGHYRRTIDASLEGEWSYSPERKGGDAFRLWNAFMAAVLRGQARVARGLAIEVPVLVALSARSDFGRRWDEQSMTSADLVLDVRALALASSNLGRCVTLVRIEGGLHDLALSREQARQQFFDQTAAWLCAYGPPDA